MSAWFKQEIFSICEKFSAVIYNNFLIEITFKVGEGGRGLQKFFVSGIKQDFFVSN